MWLDDDKSRRTEADDLSLVAGSHSGYGIGNSALALYCTALVMVLVTVCAFVRGTDARARTLRVGFVVAALVLSCVLLATPGLGTKFGSVPTLISGLAVFALAVAGIRATVRNVLLITGSAGAVMLVARCGYDAGRGANLWRTFIRAQSFEARPRTHDVVFTRCALHTSLMLATRYI